MDVMQLNIKSEEGIPFEFRDHAYGFVLRAEFSHGNIEQEHRYR